jgi:hypothetical protein
MRLALFNIIKCIITSNIHFIAEADQQTYISTKTLLMFVGNMIQQYPNSVEHFLRQQMIP